MKLILFILLISVIQLSGQSQEKDADSQALDAALEEIDKIEKDEHNHHHHDHFHDHNEMNERLNLDGDETFMEALTASWDLFKYTLSNVRVYRW